MNGAQRQVFFVEDDEDLRRANVQMLELAEIAVTDFDCAQKALAAITPDQQAIIVSDIRMPGMTGMELLMKVHEVDPDIPVILITGHGDIPMAIEALKRGASDFMTKPFSSDHLLAAIENALRTRALTLENRRLRTLAAEADRQQSPFLGESKIAVRLREQMNLLANADVDVLLQGETGTGKELVATILHRKSRRGGRPFIAVNSGSLPEGLAEIELFGQGHDEGRSTTARTIGRIEAANGGTLFLDEVDSMPPDIQLKFLRVLEEREIHPVGAPRAKNVDIRVIAATKVDLAQAVQEGRFRADLYYRLNVVRLILPPLRERREDIDILFASFVEAAKEQSKITNFVMTDDIRRYLVKNNWMGNVRELRNYTYQCLFRINSLGESNHPEWDLRKRMDAFEESLIRHSLKENNGNIDNSSVELKISRKSLYDKISKYRIFVDEYRNKQ